MEADSAYLETARQDSGPRESRMPRSVALDFSLTKAMRQVAAVVGLHTNATGRCFLKEATIADKASLSRRTVQRALNGLVERGHLAKRSTGRALELRWCAKNDASGAPKVTHQVRQCRSRSDSQESHQMRLPGVASHINGLSNVAAAAAPDPDSGKDPGGGARKNTQGALSLLRWISTRLGVDYHHDDRALGVVRGWLDDGATEAQVRSAIERAAGRRKFEPPLWVGYFTELVQEEASRPPRSYRASGSRSPSRLAASGVLETAGAPIGQRAPEPDGPPQWLAMRAALKTAMGEDTFASWIAPLQFVCVTADGTLKLRAPSRFHADWVRRHHEQALRHAAARTQDADDVEVES